MSDNTFMDMFGPQQYETIQPVEVVFDGNDKPLDKEDLKLTPLQVIKGMARTLGQEINDPKPNCKLCYGRGYTGRDSESKAPIPCLCMYPKDAIVANNHVQSRMHHKNRSERRQYEKYMAKQMKLNSKRPPYVEEVDIDNI
jgi:hypothetical protein